MSLPPPSHLVYVPKERFAHPCNAFRSVVWHNGGAGGLSGQRKLYRIEGLLGLRKALLSLLECLVRLQDFGLCLILFLLCIP